MTAPGQDPAFVDQDDISDDELLYRRIPPQWIDWETLDDEGRPRMMRAAFQDYKTEKAREMGLPGPCMSIGLHSILIAHRGEPLDLLERWGMHYGIASLPAGAVRANGDQGVMRWPTPEEPWHGVVFTKVGSKRTGGMENTLARAASWVYVPDRGS